MHKNVSEVLDNTGKYFKIHKHSDLPKTIKSPKDFANALGYKLSRITKSLFVRSTQGDKYAIVVCPMDKSINFPIISESLECKRVEVAKREELEAKIGYPPNGVSPIGIKDFPIFLDENLLRSETILLGAGEVGIEIEMSPKDVQEITNGIVLDFAINK